jgi:hypothetical protein
MPLHVERETAELAQESYVKPDIRNVKIEKMVLHQANKLVCGKIPAGFRQIEWNNAGVGAVSSHFRVIREYHARLWEGGGGCECMLDHRRAQAIVGRRKQNKIAGHEVEAGIACGVDPAVFRMTINAKIGNARRQRLKAQDAVIGRAVVDHDDLEWAHGLLRDRGRASDTRWA